jgi:hypothetical protein
MFGKNTTYQIKTKNGFEDFAGVRKLEDRKTFCVVLENDAILDCTSDHKLMTPFGFVELSKLYEGDVVETIDGYKKIVRIYPNNILEPVYDVINAGKDYQYYTNGVLSKNCEFIGSTNTLIHPIKLRSLVWHNPIDIEGNLRTYKKPQPGRTYCMTVDVAEGQGLDYSVFSVIDVTEIPYRSVAVYRDNKISPFLFPTIIVQTAKLYNDAFILIEINSIGLQVSDIIHHELAYENLIKIEVKGKQGQQQTPGFKKKVAFGIRQSQQTKMIGCTNLKTLIESDKLIVNDEQTINELITFSADKKSFKAEEGNHDDCVMTLVNFGWLTGQKYFKENINNDIRQALQKEILDVMDQDIVPFGVISGYQGEVSNKDYEVDENGDVWIDDRSRRYPFDDLNWRGKL